MSDMVCDVLHSSCVLYKPVPAWLAWESFGDKNGTDTFAEMATRIEAIRRRAGSALLARPQG